SAGPLPCQGTPEGPKSPAPSEQSPPGLPSIEASGLEPAGSEAIITPVTSPESALGAVSWMLPLVWLEKTLNAPSLLESTHSLPLNTSQQDSSGSVTPVPTMATGTSTTPVPTMAIGTSTTPVSTMAIGTSITPVPSMATGTSMTPVPTMAAGTSTTPHLWDVPALSPLSVPSCPREQLKTLPRAELEGRLESTLIIIEALAFQLRGWQESRRLLPGVGLAKQRDVFTQTDITCPEGVREELYRRLYLEQRRQMEALQRQRGAEQDLQRELELAAQNMVAWSSQCLEFRGLVDGALQRLQDKQGALVQEREQVRALVSRCKAVLERVPSKLQSYMDERDAMRQRADE
ncbi:SPAG5 protein, partial [Sakesphorus luctuosus]|nr:SPAG5 protein [Sakesphorus luctuosus]